jgi:hypothetical protein
VVQLGLLLRRDLREGHAHAKPVTVVSNFAENFQHLVVMGETKTNARTWWDGIQRVDVAARAADIRCARTESGAARKLLPQRQHHRVSRRTSPLYRRIRHSASPSNQHKLVRLPGGVRSWRGMTSQRPDDPISFSRRCGGPIKVLKVNIDYW